MELIDFKNYLEKVVKKPLVVAIGQFDGFHLAHLSLLNKVKEIGKEKNYQTALITFDPHPDFVLKKNADHTYITPIMDKAKVVAQLNIDYMIVIHFDLSVANTLPQDFVKKYLLNIDVKEVVVGFDFMFGRKGEGKANKIEELSQYSLKVHIIDEIKYKDEKLGSSLIRSLLEEGRVEEVCKIMGRPYRIEATVIVGRKIGRTIHLPTANLEFSSEYAKVKHGVYGVIVTYNNEKYVGIANYGHNPTFNYKEEDTLEVHILNFNGDLYGENLTVDFITFIRPEIKFENKEAFLKQIEKDTHTAKIQIEPFLSNENINLSNDLQKR